MYKCNDCGYEFEDAVRTVLDYHSEVGGWPEYEYTCPGCGSENFDEAFTCSCCDTVCSTNEEYPGEICDKCAHDIQSKFEALFFAFPKNQRECIRFFIEEGIV